MSLLGTIGLRELFLHIFGSPHNLGEQTLMGYILLYVLPSIPDSFFILLTVLINVALYLLARPKEMDLYIGCSIKFSALLK